MPINYEYDIHVAIKGGIRYIKDDLIYRISYKKLEGLDQWINLVGVDNGD